MPFFFWLRFLTGQKLMTLHRHHLGTRMRDAGRRSRSIAARCPRRPRPPWPRQLLGHVTRPSEAAIRAEMKLRLQEALNSMDPIDREVLALRHFEQLSHAETAQVLGIQESAAGKRYIRALKRLKQILAQWPGGLGGLLAMTERSSGPRPGRGAGRRVPRAISPRRAALAHRVHRRSIPSWPSGSAICSRPWS